MVIHEYKPFKMDDDKFIKETFKRQSYIINDLNALGKIYSNREIVRKVLFLLTKLWQAKLCHKRKWEP